MCQVFVINKEFGIGLFACYVIAHELDGQSYPSYELTEEMLQKAKDLKLSALLFMGENEMLRLLPLWREPSEEIRGGVIPLGREDKQWAFNNWRRVGGCGPTSFLKEGEAGDLAEQRIGARFERTESPCISGAEVFHRRQRESAGRVLIPRSGMREDGALADADFC